MRALLIAVGVVLCVMSLAAQDDPIRCWWRTSQGAIAVGEPLDATLTCAVRDQDAVRTVADESRLPAAVVPLTPFEVLGGTHPADLRSPTHRFFQYHYTMRIIDRDVIGRDAHLPDLPISYRVHTRVNGEWVEGRERTYTVRGGSVRVLSLVPADADDIRDADGAPFERAEALRFRARAFEIGGIALAFLGLIVSAPAVLSLRRTRRADGRDATQRVSDRSVLDAARREMALVARDARGGWTEDLAARALAALRLGAAVAAGRGVSVHANERAAGAGHLVLQTGVLRRRRLVVSSSITASDIRSAQASTPASQVLADAIDALTRAVYGRSTILDSQVDEALAAAATALGRVPSRR